MNGYRSCQKCQYIYNKLNQTCQTKCGEDEVYFDWIQECIKSDNIESDCTQRTAYLSTDKKICSPGCTNEIFSRSEKKCIKSCGVNEYEFYLGSTIQCVPTCQYYISSDKTKCVELCASLGEIDPIVGNICEKCPDSLQPAFFQSTTICINKNDPDYIEKQHSSLSNFFQKHLNPKYKAILTNKIFQELQKAMVNQRPFKNTSKRLSYILNYILISTYTRLIDEKNSQMMIGTKEDMMTLSQIQIQTYRFKTNLIIDQIQNQDVLALLEEQRDSNAEKFLCFMVTLTAKNPSCTLSDCSSYPVITVHPPINLEIGSRILQQVSDTINTNPIYTATYTVKDTSNLKKHICLSYNIYDSTVQPKITTTTIQSDNKSITCLVDGDVQLFFDKKCQFVDKNLCTDEPNQNGANQGQEIQMEESEDKLNGGEIAGIVIGSVVFAGLIFLCFLYFLRRSKSTHKIENITETAKNLNQAQTLGAQENVENV